MRENPFGKIRPNVYNELNNCYETNVICCDRAFLLSKEDESSNDSHEIKQIDFPEISVTINKSKINALIDTGSNVTCISEKWFLENKHHIGHFEELPITNTHIKTATGDRSKRITKIIMLPVMIENEETQLQVLLIPNLVRNLIIGNDVLNIWQFEMNFKEKVIKLKINNNNITLKFGEVSVEGINCNFVFEQSPRRSIENENNDDKYYEDNYDSVNNDMKTNYYNPNLNMSKNTGSLRRRIQDQYNFRTFNL